MSSTRGDVERFNRWAGSYDRHYLQRIVFEPVQQTLLELADEQVPNPVAILDVGCGTGRLLRSSEQRFPKAALEGVDAAIEMVKHAQALNPARSRIRFKQARVEKLPFAAAQFDLVFSTLTFHHWEDQRQGIAEISRVLTPGGRWLLADFIATGLMRYIRRLLRLKQFPEREELDGLLQAAGLRVLAARQVQGLRGQVPVLAIGRNV